MRRTKTSKANDPLYTMIEDIMYSCSSGGMKVTLHDDKKNVNVPYYYCPYCKKVYSKDLIKSNRPHYGNVHTEIPPDSYCKFVYKLFVEGENIYKYVKKEAEAFKKSLEDKLKRNRIKKENKETDFDIEDLTGDFTGKQQDNIRIIQLVMYKWLTSKNMKNVISYINNNIGNITEFIHTVEQKYNEENTLANVINNNCNFDINTFNIDGYNHEDVKFPSIKQIIEYEGIIDLNNEECNDDKDIENDIVNMEEDNQVQQTIHEMISNNSFFQTIREIDGEDSVIRNIKDPVGIVEYKVCNYIVTQLIKHKWTTEVAADFIFEKVKEVEKDPKLISRKIIRYYSLTSVYIIASIEYSRRQLDGFNIVLNLGIILFGESEHKIALSYTTVQRRVSEMNEITAMLKQNVNTKCMEYCIALDEWDDIVMRRIGVYCRYCFEDATFVQCKLVLKEFSLSTDSNTIMKWMKTTMKELKMDFIKCVNVTSDGAPNMQGKNNGMCLQFMNYVNKKRGATNPLIMCSRFTCNAHKLNLGIKALCNCECTKRDPSKISNAVKKQKCDSCLYYLFAFKDFIKGSEVRKAWNSFKNKFNEKILAELKKREDYQKRTLTAIPLPSDIRWGYTYDIFSFMKKNFNGLKQFINENYKESIGDYYAKRDIKWIDGRIGVFDMNDKAFYASIVGVTEILYISRSVIDYYQKTACFVDEHYYIIRKLIDYLFRCMKKLGNYNEFDCSNDFGKPNDQTEDDTTNDTTTNTTTNTTTDELTKVILDDYIKATYDIENKEVVKRLNIQLIKHITSMLLNVMTKFIIINGEDNEKPNDPIDVSTIFSIDDFDKEADLKNKDNLLYQTVKMSMSYIDNDRKTTFTNVDDIVLQEYNWLMDYREQHPLCSCSIVEGIKAVGVQRLQHLYKNVLYMKTVMATSCSVESLFSFAKSVYHTNLTTDGMDKRLTIKLDTKREEMTKFEPYCDGFSGMIKFLTFKD